MMELWNGYGDATGNKVWMGALFFLEVFVCPLGRRSKKTAVMDGARARVGDDGQASKDEEEKIEEEESDLLRTALMKWRTRLFHEKRILELGAGTGAAGIALMLAPTANTTASIATTGEEEEKHGIETTATTNNVTSTTTSIRADPLTVAVTAKPSLVVFSDSDENTLSLCLKNCKTNLGYETASPHNTNATSHPTTIESGNTQKMSVECPYEIRKLDWMHQNTDDQGALAGGKTKYDTIIATDVLYDIGSLKPLIQTAARCIKAGGYFTLSHVPRASIDDEDDDGGGSIVGTGLELERLISQEAVQCGFLPVDIIGTNDCHSSLEAQMKLNRQSPHRGQGEMTVIRPRDLIKILNPGSKMMTSSKLSYDDVEDAEAAILFFRMRIPNEREV